MTGLRLHPLAWLALGGSILGLELFAQSGGHLVAFGTGAVALYLGAASDLRSAARRLGLLFLPIAIASTFVQFAGPAGADEPTWFRLHIAAVGPARLSALAAIWGRMVTILALGLFAADRADNRRLCQFVADVGLPAWTARALLSARAFVRLASDSARTVTEAQAIRGVPVSGKLIARARALPMMVIPLMANLFIEAAHRSAALERRGFDTYYGDLPKARPMRWLDGLVIVSCLVFVAWQVRR